MATGRPASTHIGIAEASPRCAFYRNPGSRPVLLPKLSELSFLRSLQRPADLLPFVRPATFPINCLLPKPTATAVLRSFRTPCRRCNGPNPYLRFIAWPPAPPSRNRLRKVPQLHLTFLAINRPLGLGTIPKATAPLANLQLHAHFHDGFSVNRSSARSVFLSFLGGVKGTRHSYSGFCCPDFRLPSVFSRY